MLCDKMVSKGENLISVACVSYPHASLFFDLCLHVLVRAFVFCSSGTNMIV